MKVKKINILLYSSLLIGTYCKFQNELVWNKYDDLEIIFYQNMVNSSELSMKKQYYRSKSHFSSWERNEN